MLAARGCAERAPAGSNSCTRTLGLLDVAKSAAAQIDFTRLQQRLLRRFRPRPPSRSQNSAVYTDFSGVRCMYGPARGDCFEASHLSAEIAHGCRRRVAALFDSPAIFYVLSKEHCRVAPLVLLPPIQPARRCVPRSRIVHALLPRQPRLHPGMVRPHGAAQALP